MADDRKCKLVRTEKKKHNNASIKLKTNTEVRACIELFTEALGHSTSDYCYTIMYKLHISL